MHCPLDTTLATGIKSHRYEPFAPWRKYLQDLKLLATCWLQCFSHKVTVAMFQLRYRACWRRMHHHVVPAAQTSSDTEVVGDLLVGAFSGQHRGAIPHHITKTSESVLNLYLHAVICMILPYRNHIRTVADRGRRITQRLRWVCLQIPSISVS
jgi:hypothetical protein